MLPVTSALNPTAPDNPSLFREDLCIYRLQIINPQSQDGFSRCLFPRGKGSKQPPKYAARDGFWSLQHNIQKFFLPSLSPPTDINSQHRWWFVVMGFWFFSPPLHTERHMNHRLFSDSPSPSEVRSISTCGADTHPSVVTWTLKWIMSHYFCRCFHPQFSLDETPARQDEDLSSLSVQL